MVYVYKYSDIQIGKIKALAESMKCSEDEVVARANEEAGVYINRVLDHSIVREEQRKLDELTDKDFYAGLQ